MNGRLRTFGWCVIKFKCVYVFFYFPFFPFFFFFLFHFDSFYILIMSFKVLFSLATAFVAVMAEEEVKEKPQALVWQDFILEIGLFSLMALYVGIWWVASGTNQKIATQWANDNHNYFEQQFAMIGNKISNEKIALIKDGPADYLLYTTGRRNVQFGHWWIKLKPRSDIFSFIISTIFALIGWGKPLKDRVNASITLDKEIPQRFVFAIVRKDLAKDTHSKRFDLLKMTKIASVNISSNYVIYAESQKLAELLISGKVKDILSQESNGLESLIITYLPDYEPERLDLEKDVKINIIYDIHDANAKEFAALPLELADTIGQLRLTGDVTTKLRKNLDELKKSYAKREAEDRAEEIAKKKAEKKRAEDERVMKLSASEQRKHEEKERNREKKRELKKKTKRA
ncbi:unnamed protein product [Cunninghamella blakesleeana]